MSTPEGGFTARSLRLETLVRLRWLAVAGQLAAVAVVNLGLGFALPIVPCLALILLSALLNVVLSLRHPASRRLTGTSSFLLLAYDVLQLSGLLYLTGGLDNPFSFLLLVPVIISATTLAPRPTLLLGVLVVATATGLAIEHWPLPWKPGEALVIPGLYSAGVWIALVSTCAFTGIYTFRVAEEARQLAAALYATEMVLAREQHLSALDGLAAAAAHELGTPLATISLVAKELQRAIGTATEQADDVALLRSQAERCREILAKLTSLSDDGDHVLTRLTLSHLLAEVAEPYRVFSADIVIAPPRGAGPEPVARHNPAIVQGLVNLLENAVDFATKAVEVTADWTDSQVRITIADDGPGFAPGILNRLGEPYLTTRGNGDHKDGEAGGGLGLGLFIATSLLERTGGRLTFANRRPPDKGAEAAVVWSRGGIDATGGEVWLNAETAAERTTWREELKSV